jgi:hypothetical protein
MFALSHELPHTGNRIGSGPFPFAHSGAAGALGRESARGGAPYGFGGAASS